MHWYNKSTHIFTFCVKTDKRIVKLHWYLKGFVTKHVKCYSTTSFHTSDKVCAVLHIYECSLYKCKVCVRKYCLSDET